MARFQTHVGLEIVWEQGEVAIIGEVRKVLYPINGEQYTLAGAREAFDYTREHYQQREAADAFACDDPECQQRGKHSAEAHVPFVRRRGKGE